MPDYMILAAYILAGYLIHKYRQKQKTRDITPELLERIDKIYYIKQQYVKAQELLFDIDMSKEEQLKGISLEWATAAGVNKALSIWADGKSRTTKQMRLTMHSRLEELGTSLNDELDKIPKRHRKNVERTYHSEAGGEQP